MVEKGRTGCGVKSRVLVVDDEQAIRFGIRRFLEAEGFEVTEAGDSSTALETFREERPDACLLDYMLPDGTALELLPRFKVIDSELPVVVMTGHSSVDLAVRAMKEGAENFVSKPVDLPALGMLVQRAIDHSRERRNQVAGKSRQKRSNIDPFRGESQAIKRLRDDCERAVLSEAPVLLLGETGVGKGVLARWFHDHGPRADEPFVDLNCAGLSKDFLETELFGHQKGAFTGAVQNKQGLLEVAHKGSVFLDEIGDMDPQVQPKLLKVLEEKRYRRLGDHRDTKVDIRLIAATHQELPRLVAERRFRQDLYFRVSTLPLMLPPLRQREDDVLALAERFVAEFAPGREIQLARSAREALRNYEWPGNIRELRNVIERAVLLSPGDTLQRQDLRFDGAAMTLSGQPPQEAGADQQRSSAASSSELTMEEMEILHIRRALEASSGSVANAARRLDVPRSTLYQKIKRFGIEAGRPN